jgi:hypothetical protein
MATTPEGGIYLYAILPAAAERDYGTIGIGGSTVRTVSDGVVSAVVSDFEGTRIRPERRNIAAHQAVLKRLLADESPLPISFGTVASQLEDVMRILSLNRESFRGQLERVSGKVEMGVRLLWDVPNIFEYFINTHPELRSIRDLLFLGHHEPSQADKMEVGRLFDRTLQDDREKHTRSVEDELEPTTAEIKRLPVRSEKEVLNLACLVPRQNVETSFEAAILSAARAFDNNYAFDFNGPWAPHNFVDVDLVL